MASLNDWPRRSSHRGHDPILDDDLHRTGAAPLKEADADAMVGLLTQSTVVSTLINGTSGNDVRNGTSAADTINGLAGNDTLNGLGGRDTLDGGSGNDKLDGGGDADLMIGGTGNDSYIVNHSGDKVVETSSTGGTDTVTSFVSFTLPTNVENLVLGGGSAINGTGNSLSNHLTGNSGANKLSGLAGNDTLNGLSGRDTLDGGSGNDKLDGGSDADSMIGGTGDDNYIVNHSGDKVVETSSSGGTDTVTSFVSFTLPTSVENLVLGGGSAINGTGNSLSNHLAGNSGANKLSGVEGNDTIDGSGGNDSLNGSFGTDSLSGSSGNDILDGGTNNDTLNGGADADSMVGGAGFDSMIGGTGNDTLTGGAGTDVLNGGEGDDTAVFAGNFADYEITNANGVLKVTDLDPIAGGNDGTNTLASIESLQFADRLVPLVMIDLTDLAPTTGFIIKGETSGDAAGISVSSAGDINGDGFDDVIVGAFRGADGGFDAGAAYVVFGGADGFGTLDGSGRSLIDLATLVPGSGFVIQGDAYDLAGRSVSSAGDVNGDGFDDLIVGAPDGDYYHLHAGEAYVVFGGDDSLGTADGTGRSVLDLGTLAPADGFIIQGDMARDLTGVSVSSAGDINGDGFDDLIVGAPYGNEGGIRAGEAYVVFGGADGFGTVDATGRSVIDLTTLVPASGFVIQGDTEFDHAGFSAASAGDVNGDGFDDLIVGAPNGNGDYAAGEAYVVFGAPNGFGTVDGIGRSVIDLTTLASTAGFVIQGDAAGDFTGTSVSSAGDVNGDGFDDLIIGAPAFGYGDPRAGEAYVVFGGAGSFGTTDSSGRAVIDLTTLIPAEGFIIKGDAAYDNAGRSVSSAGDVNGDGFDDLIVGAYYSSDGGFHAGDAYVVFGGADGFGTVDGTGRSVIDLATLAPPDGFIIQGDNASDLTGISVSSAGDVNGDGFDDLIVGAPQIIFDYDGPQPTGEAYVVFGGDFLGRIVFAGDADDNSFTGTAAPESFVGAQGNDTLTGNGGADVFHGGEGDDTIKVSTLDFSLVDGGTGKDTLALDGAGLNLDLTTLANNRIQDIEQIDLTGTGVNTLTLGVLDVLDLSDSSNTLVVKGNADDKANIGTDWTAAASGGTNGDGTSTIDGHVFQIYASGQATLLVDQDVNTAAV
jgi:Ca2+-binding RTX toxin-like protein